MTATLPTPDDGAGRSTAAIDESPAKPVEALGRPRRRRRRGWVVLCLVAGLALVVGVAVHPSRPSAETAFGSAEPSIPAVTGQPVTVGSQITVRQSGDVVALRVYRSPQSVGQPEGAVYSETGEQLAHVRFPASGAGWRSARLDKPLSLTVGTTVTVAVFLPDGTYAASNNFAWPAQSPSLMATQGLYEYGPGLSVPATAYRSTSYFVDVSYVPRGAPGVALPVGSAPAPTDDGAPESTQLLDLPRVPWDGGPEYWSQFAKAREAGWDDPSFFPVGVWWSGVSSDEEAQFDKRLGLNFYTQMNADTDYRLIERNGMFWVGGPSLKHLSESSPNWVGSFLDDEVDGRFEPADKGFSYLQKLADPLDPAKTGRFRYTNYTSGVLSYDRSPADAQRYVNGFAEAVSVDQYFYSVPQCDWKENWSRYIVEVPKATCRTAHSYGLMMDALRTRDAADKRLQPLFNFVENASPYGDTDGFHEVGSDQVQGAVMSSLIHEARGIVWFNQQFAGSCTSGNYFRRAQHEPTGCAVENTDGARKINLLVRRLAPVLNTQSYRWDFGPDLDTMLKVKDGKSYVFAMTTGTAGDRTFTLPEGIDATTVKVVDENRSIPLDGRVFSDTFRLESSYHVYEIGGVA